MATPTAARPARTLAVLAVLTVLVFGLIWAVAPDKVGKDTLSLGQKYSTRLGLDLEGGTSVILTPRITKGETGTITRDALNQAVSIIRSRVDSFGVAESEVTTAGNNIVISLPGKQDKSILATVQQTAELRFRQVLLSGSGVPTPVAPVSPSPSGSASPSATASPSASGSKSPAAGVTGKPSPSTSAASGIVPKALQNIVPKALQNADTPSPTASGSGSSAPAASPTPATPSATATVDPTAAPAAGAAGGAGFTVTPALQKRFDALDCSQPEKVRQQLRLAEADDPKQPLVTCSEDGIEKFVLAPAEVVGTDVKTASAGLQTNSQGVTQGGWAVSLEFNGNGKKKFAEVTRREFAQPQGSDLNRFAIVLDGLIVSAPQTNGVITNGQAEISGNFSQKEATSLANVLKFGALPLTFDAGSVEEVSATLGGDQLRAGIIAGGIGLLLVVLYSLLYYRGLGLVTVASLVVSGTITYGLVVLLGWQIGFRLSLAGIAGLIVAIGITADSFIVYFERIRDEVRDGRTLRVAVESGWVRARRTILAADFVSFLAAVVLYVLSVGSVRGFAFTLGLTTLIDILVVFLFTKPLVSILAKTTFFGQGHKLSGLDPQRLGATKRTLLTPGQRRRGGSTAAGAGTASRNVKEA